MSSFCGRPEGIGETNLLALRAALLQGDAAIEAWRGYANHVALDDIEGPVYGLVPLIARNLSEAGAKEPDLQRMHGIGRRNWTANQFHLKQLRGILSGLRGGGLDVSMHQGISRARFYEEVSPRSLSDGFLRLSLPHISVALQLLARSGWTPREAKLSEASAEQLILRQGMRLRGADGNELVLRWHFFPDGRGAAVEDDLARGIRDVEWGGIGFSAFEPEAELFHAIIGAGLMTGWDSLLWAVDACMILRQAGGLDLGKVKEWAKRSHLDGILRDGAGQLVRIGAKECLAIPDAWKLCGEQVEERGAIRFPFSKSISHYRRLKPSFKRHGVEMGFVRFLRVKASLKEEGIVRPESGEPASEQRRSPPEHQVLLLIARPDLSNAQVDRLKEILGGGVNWAELVSTGIAHGMIPWMERHLLALDSSVVPRPVRMKLRLLVSNHRKKLGKLVHLHEELSQALGARGIAVLPYKGATLGALAFGDFMLRQSVDADILVPAEHALDARSVIKGLGFHRREDEYSDEQVEAHLRDMYHFHFVRDSDGCETELHWDIMIPRVSIFDRAEELWEETTRVDCGGVELPCMSPEAAFVSCIVHGCKHGWGKLSQLMDLQALVTQPRGVDWDRVLGLLRETRNVRSAQWSLALMMGLLGGDLSTVPEELKKEDAEIRRRVRAAVPKFFRPKPRLTDEDMFRLLLPLRDGRVGRMKYAVRFLLTPTRGDREWVRLPDTFSFAYGLLRPIRLVGRRFFVRS